MIIVHFTYMSYTDRQIDTYTKWLVNNIDQDLYSFLYRRRPLALGGREEHELSNEEDWRGQLPAAVEFSNPSDATAFKLRFGL